MEESVEYLKGVKCLEINDPPEKNNWNNNNSSGLKKLKRASVNVTRMKSPETSWTTTLDGNAESHTTDHCNKKNLLSGLLDGHKNNDLPGQKRKSFVP
eukprot:4411658-Ditylum_brightwellii.AAC.1